MKYLINTIIIALLSLCIITILKSCKKVTLPDVSTANITEITQSSAVSGGNVTNNGGAEVTARGVCWSITENPPTISSSKTNDGTGNGPFTSNITGLLANTKYYVCAYAINGEGTAYGLVLDFTTNGNPPMADFSASQTTVTVGQSIQFTDESANTPTSWYWNFGDGSTSTSQSPSHTYSTTGTYTVILTATNSAGSDIETKTNFITVNPVIVATIMTTPANSITTTSGVSGGNITDDGGGTITARGICWSTNVNPTTSSGSITTEGTGTGSFTSNLTGLQPGTIYYLRAYATNGAGTAYGNQVTLLTYISDKDGNIYKTIAIGSQIWMKENLKTTKYQDGAQIINVSDYTQWVNLTTSAFCWYNNDASIFKDAFGALYNWYAVVDNRKICPLSWHVPSYNEWITLSDFLGGLSLSGGKLKEEGTSHWISPNTGATNESGFTALPGGYRHQGVFNWVNYGGYWWSSTEFDSIFPWDFYLAFDFSYLGRSHDNDKKNGFSVRCIKDN